MDQKPTLNSVEFINTFGIVFQDRFIIPSYSSTRQIFFDDLKSILLLKKRNRLFNNIALAISIIATILLFFFELNYTLMTISSLLLFASITFFFFFKKDSYRLKIALKNNTIEFNILPSQKEAAKKIIFIVKRKRKKLTI